MSKFIEFDITDRGFVVGEFKDRYDKECSIQDSSLATEEAIWLGMDSGDHIKDYLGEEHCCARMHLTREMAAELVVVLQYFVDHGHLPFKPEK